MIVQKIYFKAFNQYLSLLLTLSFTLGVLLSVNNNIQAQISESSTADNPEPAPHIANPEYKFQAHLKDLQANFATKPTAQEALKKLKDGNARFVNNKLSTIRINIEELKQNAMQPQSKHCFASLLSCSDSRVPLELIFDQGVLNIFVVRVAGNTAAPSQIASIEYGLAHIYTPILIVLGHEDCGAVAATIQTLQSNTPPVFERNIPELIKQIKPAVLRTKQAYPEATGHELLHLAIEENVYEQIAQLFYESPITRLLVKNNLVQVHGAVYSVKTGQVRWLPSTRINDILTRVLQDPKRAKDIYSDQQFTVPQKDIPQMQLQESLPAPQPDEASRDKLELKLRDKLQNLRPKEFRTPSKEKVKDSQKPLHSMNHSQSIISLASATTQDNSPSNPPMSHLYLNTKDGSKRVELHADPNKPESAVTVQGNSRLSNGNTTSAESSTPIAFKMQSQNVSPSPDQTIPASKNSEILSSILSLLALIACTAILFVIVHRLRNSRPPTYKN